MCHTAMKKIWKWVYQFVMSGPAKMMNMSLGLYKKLYVRDPYSLSIHLYSFVCSSYCYWEGFLIPNAYTYLNMCIYYIYIYLHVLKTYIYIHAITCKHAQPLLAGTPAKSFLRNHEVFGYPGDGPKNDDTGGWIPMEVLVP